MRSWHVDCGVAANGRTEPAKLSRLMKGELDWLVLKALEKDLTRRYDTANAFSRDIQRYLADELVEARPPSTNYRLKKFARRHKPPYCHWNSHRPPAIFGHEHPLVYKYTPASR